MKKPLDKHKNEDDTSRLYFDHNEEYADYYMRGGICWPATDQPGFILLAGQDVHTQKVFIFEQREFLTVNNILHPEKNTIEHKGVASFFNGCWNRYFARKYYWHQSWELHKSHRLEVMRSKQTINPSPVLIEISWPDEKDVRGLIWKYQKLGRIAVQKDTKLAHAIMEAKNSDREVLPPVHALQCLLAGLERHPWRKRT